MSLPTSRNFTYVVGDPVRRVDMNDLQDQIIAAAARIASLEARFTTPQQILLPAAGAAVGQLQANTNLATFATSWGTWHDISPTLPLLFGLPLHVGDQVLSVDLMSDGLGNAGTRTIELVLNAAGGDTASVVTSATSTATGTGWKAFNLADTVLGSTGIYSIRLATTATEDKVAGIRVTYDHP